MADKTTGDVIDILTADHREMLELIDQIENTKDPAERRALAGLAPDIDGLFADGFDG